ncbi:remorin-like [Prosopis cineraria]|uniref:remorin-like n=1 Tax=Prosopis cineraria TaxID=364024 RepID=UPI00240F6E87|nr:remorin-like [Prosopis cineraria]
MEGDEAKASNSLDSAGASTSEPRDDKDSENPHSPQTTSRSSNSQSSFIMMSKVIQPQALSGFVYKTDPTTQKPLENSRDRDIALARVESEKRLAFIKAWEESEKTKAENKACKKLSTVNLWEDRKKISIQAQLKKIEEGLERKKAEQSEKMKNKVAEIHQLAEEKRAVIEAQKFEDYLNVEETAAKYRSRGFNPRKFQLLSCFTAYFS